MKHTPISLGKIITKNNLGMTIATLTKWFDRNAELLKNEDCVMVMKGSERTTRRVIDEEKFIEILKRG